MSALWAALVELFGPMLVELLKNLLDKWFAKAAAKFAPGTTFNNRESQLRLVDTTLELVPWFRPRIRAALREMRAGLEKGGTASAEEAARLLAAVGDASDE